MAVRSLLRWRGWASAVGVKLAAPFGVTTSIDATELLINALSFHFMDESLRIDAIDRQIVAQLERNARASFATVGHDVGLSAPAVKRRVDRLMDAGVITGFRASVDANALGHGVEAFVELYTKGRTSAVEIARVVARVPEVQDAWTVTGDANALLRVRTSDTAHLERTLEDLRDDPAVLQTKSCVVLSGLLPRSS